MSNRLAKLLACDIDTANLPVRTEQIRARLHNYPLMVGGEVLIVLLLIALLWHKVAHPVLLGWVAVLFAALTLEMIFVQRYKHATNTLTECRVWRNRMVVFVSMVGAIWGAGGALLFVADDLAYQALLICVLLGVAAGAATTNPVFPPALYLFISLLLAPLTMVNALIGDTTHLILAAMLVVYWVYILGTGRDLAHTFELSFRRAFENARLIEQLREKQQLAEQASLLKSRFLAAASHDLRQPIHALGLFLDALQHHVQGEQGHEVYGKVVCSVATFNDLLDALLDLSRLDAGVIQPRPQLLQMPSLLVRLHDEFVMLAREKGLLLEMDCPHTEPVYSDPLLLERVLRNLISNAIHYTEQGRISVTTRPVEGGLELVVQDSGIGIAPDQLMHIFEEYYQAGSQHGGRHHGLGLGLAIVRRLEQLLYLQLQVSSTPGVGTRFVMVIPERRVAERAGQDGGRRRHDIALPW